MLLLGLDAGTQSVKALVYDTSSCAVVGRGAVAYDILTSAAAPGRAEQQPESWLQASLGHWAADASWGDSRS